MCSSDLDARDSCGAAEDLLVRPRCRQVVGRQDGAGIGWSGGVAMSDRHGGDSAERCRHGEGESAESFARAPADGFGLAGGLGGVHSVAFRRKGDGEASRDV